MNQYYQETDFDIIPRHIKTEIYEMAMRRSDELEFIHRPWRDINYDSTQQQIEEKVGIKLGREFKRRRLILAREFGHRGTGVEEIVIDQHRLPKDLSQPIVDETNRLLGIDKEQIDVIVQIQDGGNLLYPHRGHGRVSSLFCLLAGTGEKTTWYRETEPFEDYDIYKIPDYSKLEEDCVTCLREDVWTTFNHYAWHSVKRNGNVGTRINININFESLTYEQLMETIKNVGGYRQQSSFNQPE